MYNNEINAMNANPVGEFFEEFTQRIYKSMYEGLYSNCEKLFNAMFSSLNTRIASTSAELTTSPKDWSPSGFVIIQNAAETIFIPIGACIITFVFCWELIHIMQDNNQMHNIRPDTIMMQLLKLCLCLLACSKYFDIVMGFFEVGAWATSKLSAGTVGTCGEGLALADLLPAATDPMKIGIVFEMIGNLILLLVGNFAVLICSAIIYIRVVLWFLEILIYSSAAPMPFATFGNREWSQMGMNYTRKMLALCFEGFFMLMAYALYGGVVSGIGGGSFAESMVLIIGCGYALVMIMFKAGNISANIFNAH